LQVRKAGLFLDGCKVYVSGGAPVLQDKLRKLLNTGGATRFDDISESLSHILLAGASLKTAEAKELGKLSRQPPVVPLLWLLKSIELKHPAHVVGPQGTEPPSPLSKRGMQMFETVPKLTISPR
jgi:topoisomerase (DNA) II binding protein 1